MSFKVKLTLISMIGIINVPSWLVLKELLVCFTEEGDNAVCGISYEGKSEFSLK